MRPAASAGGMRALALLLVVALSSAALPTVAASHRGPCTHEWFEILDYAVGTGNVPQALGYVGACVTGTVQWACFVARCEAIIA